MSRGVIKSPGRAAADLDDVIEALEHLRRARMLLKRAGSRQTLDRVRKAITSCGGAVRHARAVQTFTHATWGQSRHVD